MSMSERVLYLLKTGGSHTAAMLATALDLTTVGARKHLLALQDKGLVQAEERSQGVGRPAQYWQLTAAGHARFPDRHAEMTVQLLGHLRQVFGAAGVEQLISAREQAVLTTYQQALADCQTLAQRLEQLVALRNSEGYMAQCLPQADGWLLLENHCPICAAARACQGFCRSELALFQQLLGDAVSVERVEHILDGAQRCAYRVSLLR